MGHSSGAVASLHAAAESQEIAAVIADSAFISMRDLMARFGDVLSKDKQTPLWVKIGARMGASRLAARVVLPLFFLRTGVYFDARAADV